MTRHRWIFSKNATLYVQTKGFPLVRRGLHLIHRFGQVPPKATSKQNTFRRSIMKSIIYAAIAASVLAAPIASFAQSEQGL
ncbi:hypothetical protein SB778_34420, partial [Paraburkholderia sp. SIMBA_050]